MQLNQNLSPAFIRLMDAINWELARREPNHIIEPSSMRALHILTFISMLAT